MGRPGVPTRAVTYALLFTRSGPPPAGRPSSLCLECKGWMLYRCRLGGRHVPSDEARAHRYWFWGCHRDTVFMLPTYRLNAMPPTSQAEPFAYQVFWGACARTLLPQFSGPLHRHRSHAPVERVAYSRKRGGAPARILFVSCLPGAGRSAGIESRTTKNH